MSGQQPPFIYIAALMRTGSTVISEALTQLPYAYIFREPHIGKNDFRPKSEDIERLSQYGIHLEQFLRFRKLYAFLQRRLHRFGYRQDYMVRLLKHELMPQFVEKETQIGIKEIRNTGWENYLRHFPDMKVIVTGRDPRDIYLSTYYGWQKGLTGRYRSITPEIIAQDLKSEFEMQQQIIEAAEEYYLIRYEDLCTDSALTHKLLAFVESPIPERGQIGQFNKRHPNRKHEYRLHGDKITDKRVKRWRRENDARRVEEAYWVFDHMREYTDFWNYER